MGLRRLLNRQAAQDPLERLAELGRQTVSAATPTPRQKAPADARDCPPAVSGVAIDKKVELVSESAGQVSEAKSKKAAEPPRSRSGYVWRSQASRSKRAAWADMPERF